MMRLALVAAATWLVAMPAFAADPIALSAEEREAAIEAGAARAPINGAPGLDDGRLHGEMSVTVGSNGLRAVEGTTAIPLGQNGVLALSFANVSGGRWRGR